jgi:DNA mismatch endonuclease, patch repair protein
MEGKCSRKQGRLRQQVSGKWRTRRSRPAYLGIDFVFPKERVVVFVDGCFWHGCPRHSNPARWIRKSSMARGTGLTSKSAAKMAALQFAEKGPRTGKLFWARKMMANMARDRFVNRELRKRGWRVIRIWEYELAENPERCVKRVVAALL